MSPLATLLPELEARERILSLIEPLPPEEVAVEAALGRALSEDIVALRTLPSWDNSAMDGYAVRAADTGTGDARLRVVETLFAGQRPQRAIGPGECARIMTGAPMPEGADTVVMQEKTRRASPDDPFVDILETARKGQNVRDRGEDAKQGELLLPRGTPLGLPEAALLYAQGIGRVCVPRRPRVAILATGDELVPVGTPLHSDEVVDINSPNLAEAVRRAGGAPEPLGIAKDDPADVRRKLEGGIGADVLITSAGASVGERDFTKEVLGQLGVQMQFWKVAIKPGKPLAVGVLGKTLVLGMPGNPTSSLVVFELFGRPALKRMLGWTDVAPPQVPGRIATAYQKLAGITHFLRAVARWQEGTLVAQPLPTQTSGAMRSAVVATHLIRVPSETTQLSRMDPVALLPVSWSA